MSKVFLAVAVVAGALLLLVALLSLIAAPVALAVTWAFPAVTFAQVYVVALLVLLVISIFTRN